MNYQSIYDQLIQHRKTVKLVKSIDTEQHHIIPKALNGSDNPDNLVFLTVREHYIAHLLLWKITEQKYGKTSVQHKKMQHAFRMMCVYNSSQIFRKLKFNARLYEKMRISAYKTAYDESFREKCSLAKLGEKNPNYHKYGKLNPNYGSKRTEEQRKHMSEAQRKIVEKYGVKRGIDHHSFGRITIKNIETGKIRQVKPNDVAQFLQTNQWEIRGRTLTAEDRKKISQAKLGKKLTDENRQKISRGGKLRFSGENGQIERKKISEIVKKLVWVKNIQTNECKRVQISELKQLLATGLWQQGRINNKMKKLIWMNNPTTGQLKRVDPTNITQISELIKQGFTYGTNRNMRASKQVL